jgi:sugar/nucleoside kinase (ribokinase family)
MTAATIIGDIFYDHVCDLSFSSDLPLDILHNDFDTAAAVAAEVGGNAVQFALAAVAEGFSPVTVIGKVGITDNTAMDAAGAAAVDLLDRQGVELLLARDKAAGTGRAIIAYLPNNHRFMVFDPGANATFQVNDIDISMQRAVMRGGLLHVSGYALLPPARRAATQVLIELARSAAGTVAIDVVPHEIDQFVNPDEIRAILVSADWIISAGSTASRLLGVGQAAGEDALMEELNSFADSVMLFPHPHEAVVMVDRVRQHHKFPYVTGAPIRGYSARLQASLLAHYLLSPDERDAARSDA